MTSTKNAGRKVPREAGISNASVPELDTTTNINPHGRWARLVELLEERDFDVDDVHGGYIGSEKDIQIRWKEKKVSNVSLTRLIVSALYRSVQRPDGLNSDWELKVLAYHRYRRGGCMSLAHTSGMRHMRGG